MSNETITKKEAARLAGVSERTLDRYVSQGYLRVFRISGSAKVSFARTDIESVKRNLELKYPAKALTQTPDATDTISFRLGTVQLELLYKASAGAGVSPGTYARTILYEHLEQAAAIRIEDHISQLDDTVRDLGHAVAESVYVLLQDDTTEPDDAVGKFVKQHFARFLKDARQ